LIYIDNIYEMNLYIGSQCRLPATIKSVRKTF